MASSCFCCYVVEQSNAGIIESIGGKFSDVAPPGCSFFNCCSKKLSGCISLRTRNINCHVDAFTSDSASVVLKICVCFRVIPSEVNNAFYKLSGVESQIQSFVISNLRASVPTKRLEELYHDRDELADRVKASLGPTLRSLGFEVVDVLVVDVDVRGDVRNSMNQQMYQKYQRVSQQLMGEIDKIYSVTNAEAEAEATRLRGVGTAAARNAITNAFKDGMAGFHGASEEELTATMLMIQYFDMVRDVSSIVKPATTFFPTGPESLRRGPVDRDALRERLKRSLLEDPDL